jgi:tetratricopeptide (TPR) repeat protein
MKSGHRAVPVVATWLLLMMTSVAPGQSGDFYETRLTAGREAFGEQRFAEAAIHFRTAAFGLMEKPALLSQALARLALAEEAAGRQKEADAALQRFLEVERRFSVFRNVRLEPPVQAQFQAFLLRRVAPETLLSMPSLAGLVETEEQKILRLSPRERIKALEEAHRREPAQARWPILLAREAASAGDSRGAVKWANRALEIDGRNAEALALRAHARVERGEFREALADLNALPPEELASRPELAADRFVSLAETGNLAEAAAALRSLPSGELAREDVARARRRLPAERRPGELPPTSSSGGEGRTGPAGPQAASSMPVGTEGKGSQETLAESRRLVRSGRAGEAEKILLPAVDADPSNRGLRLALLEASCLARAWQRAAAQIPLLSPFAEEEVAPMFYAAMALYETGRTEEARAYLQRALPRVSGALVEEYSKKILGRT